MAALSPASPFGHDALDLVPAVAERALDPLHEGAQVGVVRPGIHLRDEKDVQDVRCCASYVPNTSRSSLQISPIVTRAPSAPRIGGSRFPSPSATRRTAASACSASPAFRSARTFAVRSSW